MRVNFFITSSLLAGTLLVASCSTSQLAQNASTDDVYNTVAQAKVYKYSPPAQMDRSEAERYDDTNYRSSDQNYDMDYSSRIDRFYYGSFNRPYYDDYYNYYGYNSWYNPYDVRFGMGLGFGFGFGYNNWFNPFNSWAYYGSPYRWNTWGPYSYYNGFGGYYGGHFGGGYYPGIIVGSNRPNYTPRPTRGNSNNAGRGTSVYPNNNRASGNRVTVDRNNTTRPGRTESYNPNNGRTADRSTNTSSSRPGRTQSTAPTRETYSPPARTSTPPASSSGSSGSSSGGSARPTRGGGRG